jgi:hypothetical protein
LKDNQEEKMCKRVILISLIVFGASFFSITKSSADEGVFSLEKGVKYTIILELNQVFAYKIKDAYVLGTVEISGKSFLLVQIQGLTKEAPALIAVDSVKAILPQTNIQETLIQQPLSQQAQSK